MAKKSKPYIAPVKKGSIVICIDDDSDDEDLGNSGIVLHGRNDLEIGKEYEIESIDIRNVPKENTHWTAKEFPTIQKNWVMIKLKGIKKESWLKFFKIKKK